MRGKERPVISLGGGECRVGDRGRCFYREYILFSRIPEYGPKQRLLNNAACIPLTAEASAVIARQLHIRCDDSQKGTKLRRQLLRVSYIYGVMIHKRALNCYPCCDTGVHSLHT